MWLQIICLVLFFTHPLFAKIEKNVPPATIPKHLFEQFTQNDEIPVVYFYFDSRFTGRFSTKSMIDAFVFGSSRRLWKYYEDVDMFLYEALDGLSHEIKDKKVLLVGGSETPWYEAVLLTYEARPILIGYNKIHCNDPRISYKTYKEWAALGEKVDFILSISRTEHMGLGRYGDPIDPEGDLRSIKKLKKFLNQDGKLILAVPVGKDALVWNAHRIYGKKRLPRLLEGWNIVNHYGFESDDLEKNNLKYLHQPVFILEPQ